MFSILKAHRSVLSAEPGCFAASKAGPVFKAAEVGPDTLEDEPVIHHVPQGASLYVSVVFIVHHWHSDHRPLCRTTRVNRNN
jgi:hypothetical protein